MATSSPTRPSRIDLKVSRYWPAGMPGNNYPQAAFLAVPHREVLFGGAAGPGKTLGLLMAALQYVDIPGYSALLLRRTYKQLTLPGQLLDKARDTLRGSDAKWVEKESRFEFPNGSKLVFGYVDSERDLENALGPEYQFLGYDELTTFPEEHYLEFFTRLRRPPTGPLSQVPLRVRAASNPGKHGHRWVKQRFMVEAKRSRLYIPARLTDNPGIDKDSYMESLSELSPTRRAQMIEGDWDIKPVGAMFDREWFEIIEALPKRELRTVRYWDAAATQPTEENPDPDWTAGCLMSRDMEAGDYIIRDIVRFRDRPGGVEATVKATARKDGKTVPIRFEQEPGASGKHMIKTWQDLLPGYDVRGIPSMGNKPTRAAPLAAKAESNRVQLLEGPWIKDFLDEAEDFPDDGGHDDQVDSASGAEAALSKMKKRRYRV